MRWYPINRKALPGVLIGKDPLPPQFLGPVEMAVNEGDLALGLSEPSVLIQHSRTNPEGRVLVVQPEKASDLFSWINTYSTESFPMSQFARILSVEDWNIFSQNDLPIRYQSVNRSLLSCILLGEMVGQGEPELDLAKIPLSISVACYSYAFARAAIGYGAHSDGVRITTERLRLLQKDERFAPRSIGIDELIPVWSIATNDVVEGPTQYETVRIVLDALGSAGFRYHRNHKGLYEVLMQENGLWSDSAESRVKAFDHLVDYVLNDLALQRFSAALIGAAAFIVGRGTSHIGLLSPLAEKAPSCFVWFALFAGVAGPRCWDATWARTVRGVEKQLYTNVTLMEPSSADLCWIEYVWLGRTFDNSRVFFDLPKQFARALSIELVPNVSCQLRLSSDAKNSLKEAVQTAGTGNVKPRPKSQEMLWNEVDSLLKEIRSMSLGGSKGPEQPTLFEGLEPQAGGKATVRNRRARK